jgi:hypothetical protein
MLISLTLTTVGAIIPLRNIVNPSIGGNQRALDEEMTQFFAPGEQICALRYFKISYY